MLTTNLWDYHHLILQTRKPRHRETMWPAHCGSADKQQGLGSSLGSCAFNFSLNFWRDQRENGGPEWDRWAIRFLAGHLSAASPKASTDDLKESHFCHNHLIPREPQRSCFKGATATPHVKCRITSGYGTRPHFYHTPVKINLAVQI